MHKPYLLLKWNQVLPLSKKSNKKNHPEIWVVNNFIEFSPIFLSSLFVWATSKKPPVFSPPVFSVVPCPTQPCLTRPHGAMVSDLASHVSEVHHLPTWPRSTWDEFFGWKNRLPSRKLTYPVKKRTNIDSKMHFKGNMLVPTSVKR